MRAAVEDEMLIDLVADRHGVRIAPAHRASASSSSRSKTRPMGLSGELTRIARVLGVIAARKASSVRRQSGAASFTRAHRAADRFDDRAVGIVGRLDQHDLVARPGHAP